MAVLAGTFWGLRNPRNPFCFYFSLLFAAHQNQLKHMAVELITKEDLQEFGRNLLNDLKAILHTKPAKQKQWLKSKEVRKLLGISPGTLQNLRINGTLSFTSMGNILLYDYDDIEAVLEQNKISNKPFSSTKGKGREGTV